MSFRMKFLLAFGVVYFVWGSTYLAIKLAIETVPPFLMMGSRFLLGGLLLYPLALQRGPVPLRLKYLFPSFTLAMLMIVMGTGLMAWIEMYIPSGVTSLLVCISPVWLVLLESMQPGGARPGRLGVAGIGLGIVGAALLIGPEELGGAVHIGALIVLLISTFCWSAGSIYARHVSLPMNAMQTTSLQMMMGGVVLLLFSGAIGEWSRFHPSEITLVSFGAWLYLIIFGSLIVFPTYLWLVKAATPAQVGTHSYVNPLVALFLGWLVADEVITGKTIFAAVIILLAVLVISLDKVRSNRKKRSLTVEPLLET
ncbi:MAG: EamA family transporter [Acidobacteriota bacterium]|nr:EamA family transporter [Acidobacteriota bacterium]